MSTVLVNGLKVRTGPSTNSESPDYYDKGDIIQSGNLIIVTEGRYWLRYTGRSGNQRFVCARDTDGSQYVNVDPSIPIVYDLKQKSFPNEDIRNSGCCFLCSCVKGGLTTMDACLDCYNWALQSGKIAKNCYVNIEKNNFAKQISEKYGTPFHPDYQFQTNSRRSHFWLTRNGVEIFNSEGIGHH